jgi:hypothetical protein
VQNFSKYIAKTAQACLKDIYLWTTERQILMDKGVKRHARQQKRNGEERTMAWGAK